MTVMQELVPHSVLMTNYHIVVMAMWPMGSHKSELEYSFRLYEETRTCSNTLIYVKFYSHYKRQKF